MNFVYSAFGQFYDRLVVSGNNLGVPIKKKRNKQVPTLLNFLKAYFNQRRNSIMFSSLIVIIAINYFEISMYLKLNMAALIFAAIILFFYLTALYQKRLKAGEFIH